MNHYDTETILRRLREIHEVVVKKGDKRFGLYQLCPKCEGWGEVQLPETSKPMYCTCPVCNGAKLLVRPRDPG